MSQTYSAAKPDEPRVAASGTLVLVSPPPGIELNTRSSELA